jgi:zinc transporter ZupT
MALFAHQFSNGVWLGLADGQKVSFEMSLFWAILLHKLFEVLLVVSLITIDYRFKKNEKNYLRWMPQFLLFTYCILLPLGTAIGLQHWVREYQFIVANFAAGSLMGCLVFDFIGPVANDARHEFRRSLGAGFSSLAGVFVGFILSGVWHLFLDYYIDHYLS